jgi:hypothetical protein
VNKYSAVPLDFLCLNVNSLMQFCRPVRLQIAFRDDMDSDDYWLAVAEPNRSSVPGTAHLDGESASQKDRPNYQCARNQCSSLEQVRCGHRTH